MAILKNFDEVLDDLSGARGAMPIPIAIFELMILRWLDLENIL